MSHGPTSSGLVIRIMICVSTALVCGCATTTTTTQATRSPGDRPALTSEAPRPARAHAGTPATATPTPEESRKQEERPAPSERQIRALYLESTALLDSAREAFNAGDPQSAGVLYEAALRRLEESGLELGDDERITGLWTTILADMRDNEIEALARGEDAGGEPHEATPVQDLETIEEEIEEDLEEPDHTVQVAEVAPSAPQQEAQEPPAPQIPIEMNRRVRTVLDYFTGPRRGVIEAGLRRSGRYLPMIRRILREEGMPEDLAWLPLIESNFKPTALSRAGAKGLWQFIPGTGRKYGMEINWYVDERSDPEKATRAAARYLKDLHDEFGDWYLALASYNCGEGRVRRALARTGARDFWELARRRALPAETRGYVPAFLAGLTIGRDPAAHGFDPLDITGWQYDTVHVEGPADLRVLARCAGTDTGVLKELNPELRRMVTHGDRYPLRVPAGLADKTLAAYSQVPADQRLLYEWHRVRRGETLSIIARRYGSSIQAIAMENGIRNPHRIAVGASLKVPRSPVGTTVSRTRSTRSSDRPLIHVVQRRETLTAIARRYGTSPGHIARINGLASAHRIYPGQRLKVSGTAPAPRRASYKTYRVRKGDTLYGIARAHRTSVSNLRRWNGLRGNRIHPGDRIKVRTH